MFPLELCFYKECQILFYAPEETETNFFFVSDEDRIMCGYMATDWILKWRVKVVGFGNQVL